MLAGKEATRIAPHGLNANLQGGYVSLDQRCYEDQKGRTYRQLLGKEFQSDTLIADPESGRVVEVIRLSEHQDVLKAKGLGAEKPSRSNESERARQQAARRETMFRERIFAAVRAKTPRALADAGLRLVAQGLWQMVGHDSRIRLVKLWGWAGKAQASEEVHRFDSKIAKLTDDELRRFVLDCALVGEIRVSTYDTRKAEKLLEAAKRCKVDIDGVRTALKAEQGAKKGRAVKPTGGAVIAGRSPSAARKTAKP